MMSSTVTVKASSGGRQEDMTSPTVTVKASNCCQQEDMTSSTVTVKASSGCWQEDKSPQIQFQHNHYTKESSWPFPEGWKVWLDCLWNHFSYHECMIINTCEGSQCVIWMVLWFQCFGRSSCSTWNKSWVGAWECSYLTDYCTQVHVSNLGIPLHTHGGGGENLSGGIKCPHMETAQLLRNQRKKLWPSFSIINKSSHSTFLLCTALVLLSAFVHDTTLAFLLIPAMT